MSKHRRDGRPEFRVLLRAIEQRDPELAIGFYSDDARLRLLNRDMPKSAPVELRGKAQIASYLRTVFGQQNAYSIEWEVFEEDRVVFWKLSDYPNGSLGVIETTLELHGGEIVRQLDEILLDGQANCEERRASEEAAV